MPSWRAWFARLPLRTLLSPFSTCLLVSAEAPGASALARDATRSHTAKVTSYTHDLADSPITISGYTCFKTSLTHVPRFLSVMSRRRHASAGDRSPWNAAVSSGSLTTALVRCLGRISTHTTASPLPGCSSRASFPESSRTSAQRYSCTPVRYAAAPSVGITSLPSPFLWAKAAFTGSTGNLSQRVGGGGGVPPQTDERLEPLEPLASSLGDEAVQ
mmetsp:Transcript_10016/g.19228  ORF Transcript_10016/g.19228 Transcript_10016/m.19228 type:complete len:216 (+) Transcript_10016:258-905(+)